MNAATPPGRPRSVVDALPAYKPGKAASQAEAEHGITGAIKLASNENPWGPVEPVAAAMAEAATTVNRYPDHRAGELRAALAASLDVEPAMVTVGCGSAGLLQQLLFTYVDAGDEVVYPWRSFEVYPVFTQLAGGRSVEVPLVDHTADVDSVAAAVTPRTKLVLLANPNNPTGTAVDTAALDRLASRVDPGTIVVVDEAYREFNDPALGDPVEELLGRHPHVAVLRTFSKAHGLAGLRIGYMVADPGIVAAVDRTLLPFAVNSVAQAGALAALGAERMVRDRVDELRRERERVVGALRDRGHELPVPQANFVWLPIGPRTEEVALALEKLGVVVRPFPGEGIRVTIGAPEENDRFLAALVEVN